MSAPLRYVFYFAVKPEKLGEGLVSPESNCIIFAGADFQAEMKAGGSMKWIGPGAGGKPAILVRETSCSLNRPSCFSTLFNLGKVRSNLE
jgi:hypothetical protein